MWQWNQGRKQVNLTKSGCKFNLVWTTKNFSIFWSCCNPAMCNILLAIEIEVLNHLLRYLWVKRRNCQLFLPQFPMLIIVLINTWFLDLKTMINTMLLKAVYYMMYLIFIWLTSSSFWYKFSSLSIILMHLYNNIMK